MGGSGSDSETEKSSHKVKERERKKMQALAPIAKPLAFHCITGQLYNSKSSEELFTFWAQIMLQERSKSRWWSKPYVAVTKGATKRPTCCMLVLAKPAKGELGEEQEKLKADYTRVVSHVSELTASVFRHQSISLPSIVALILGGEGRHEGDGAREGCNRPSLISRGMGGYTPPSLPRRARTVDML